MSVFAERLRNLREKQGQTQVQVGKAVGKSREAVTKYEMGQREPDLHAITSIARYFNVSADYILGITDQLDSNHKQEGLDEVSLSGKECKDNEEFVPYFKLALKIKNSGVGLKEVEEFVDKLIKQKR
ncbi:transcriptional regulator with XRE-family HTH domain [Anaerobacterium chartisolvens]|uniref:Transcriptional regulator with XRE-family HTH domain n=1 Tax=Anaerobacterium chartisolvens TaxID=1297424 RepID=A0A369B419_9FIRM|nr:helix-turn-helix transcriptional regulator [Anaerobacterium chartisolvens]RCX16292.1 transcriptional regulator with XRE-family HTH domain [Anaerobacterium chartisolvens]